MCPVALCPYDERITFRALPTSHQEVINITPNRATPVNLLPWSRPFPWTEKMLKLLKDCLWGWDGTQLGSWEPRREWAAGAVGRKEDPGGQSPHPRPSSQVTGTCESAPGEEP